MASSASIPPLDKISLVGGWVETALWGISSVVFMGVCWVIFLKTDSKTNRWMLGTTSIVLYILATVHISATLRQLLEAFILVPQPPQPLFATLYFSNETSPLALLKNVIYTTVVFMQNLIVIWRFYIVWGRNWRLTMIPLVIEFSRAGVAYAGTIILARPGIDIFGSTLRDLGLISWSLDITVNVTVTSAIAGRLWYMGRKLSIASSSDTRIQSTYGTAMVTMIESGALYAAVTVVLLGLYVSDSPATLVAIDDATQIAVLVPMLIIVRVGLGLTHGLPRAYRSYVEGQAERPVSFSMGPLRFPHRRKPTNFGGQISVNREVVTTDLSKNLADDLGMSDFKGTSEDPEDRSVKSSDPLTSHVRVW
ncbi:hypothetical protein OBBRIDRAFT_797896 [Obba rivulosa]|uniref:Uncharacterized protein n=1 Tax=Obba rivulosa TaxID=1052685 RepID=A0A8E2ANZ6_9APHY|nr:hypothetical protein OBBRIDRAFT_797896 [Obba rivulosa]